MANDLVRFRRAQARRCGRFFAALVAWVLFQPGRSSAAEASAKGGNVRTAIAPAVGITALNPMLNPMGGLLQNLQPSSSFNLPSITEGFETTVPSRPRPPEAMTIGRQDRPDADAKHETSKSLTKTAQDLADGGQDGYKISAALERTFDGGEPGGEPPVYAADASRAPGPDAVDASRAVEDDLMARLNRRGVRSVVTVYGSARIASPEQARADYEETLHRVGSHPEDWEGRRELKDARTKMEMSEYYGIARRFGELIARRTRKKTSIVDGGGGGIMKAAHEGAAKAGGVNVGFNIHLPHEQAANKFITDGFNREYEEFPERQKYLRRHSAALIFFPGGFGTHYELFEVLTLMQTGKMPRVPIILVGKEHWDKVLGIGELTARKTISEKDNHLIRYAETASEIYGLIKDILRQANERPSDFSSVASET